MDTLKRFPLRALEFFISNPLKYTRSLKVLKQYNAESENYDRAVWLTKSAAEIRARYDLPELNGAIRPNDVESKRASENAAEFQTASDS
jgi:hypothetical protein